LPILHLHRDSTQNCTKYSIIGNYAARPFVRHAALLKADTALQFGADNVLVWHMGPPLVAGTKTIADLAALPELIKERIKRTTVHIVGYLDLDLDDIEGIETWLAEVDKEERPMSSSSEEIIAQYRVSPAVHWVLAENDTPLYRQFSCIGFVIECYRFISINLIDDSSTENLPEVALDKIVAAYGPRANREDFRKKIGIPGPGPWRILLAGYLFHSLDRDTDTIKHMAYIPKTISEFNFQVPDLPPPAEPVGL
jgi:hypothetical protein